MGNRREAQCRICHKRRMMICLYFQVKILFNILSILRTYLRNPRYIVFSLFSSLRSTTTKKTSVDLEIMVNALF